MYRYKSTSKTLLMNQKTIFIKVIVLLVGLFSTGNGMHSYFFQSPPINQSVQESSTSSTFNFKDDFENTQNLWQFTTSAYSHDKWMIGTGAFTGQASTKSLYVSSNNLENKYSGNSTTIHAVRKIEQQLPSNITDVTISFDWRCKGETSDYFSFWIVPYNFNPTPETSISTGSNRIRVGNARYNKNEQWKHEEFTVDLSAYAGEKIKIIFEWNTNFFLQYQPPAAVDNLIIEQTGCKIPQFTETTAITENSATVNWTVNAETSIYDYYLSETNTAPTSNTTPTGNINTNHVSLTNLQANTTYYLWVRSVCEANNKSDWAATNFSTTCQLMQLPFFEGFNTNSTTKSCWTILDKNNDNKKWDLNYRRTPYEGDMSALIRAEGKFLTNNDWLISPTINLSSIAGRKQLRFQYKIAPKDNSEVIETTNFKVLLSNSGISSENFTHTIVPQSGYDNENYKELIVELKNSDGSSIEGNINIAFVVTNVQGQDAKLLIDNFFIEQVSGCVPPKNLKVCTDATQATISWNKGADETQWEYINLPANSPIPPQNAESTSIAEPNATVENLQNNSYYDFWVRSVCENQKSSWTKIQFATNAFSLKNAKPFCAAENGIVFPNVHKDMNVPPVVAPENRFHCLLQTANPVWYYLKIKNPGRLVIRIVQNTAFDAAGTPNGEALDVDYAGFGPFEKVQDFCKTIDLSIGAPAGNPVVGCSFSAVSTEDLIIENAQTGQLYAILITNYNQKPGFIRLVQTNVNQEGAASTDCDFINQVDLGENITTCSNQKVKLKAEIFSFQERIKIKNIKWYKNNTLLDPTKYNSDKITVEESGTYKVEVIREVEISDNQTAEQTIEDAVEVNFISPFSGEIPKEMNLCDELNDKKENFNLKEYIQNLNLSQLYKAHFYESQKAAQINDVTKALPDAYISEEKTIFLRVDIKDVTSCESIFPVKLKLTPKLIGSATFSYPALLCAENTQEVQAEFATGFIKGGTFSSRHGLELNAETGAINPSKSSAGRYEVTYDFPLPDGYCGQALKFKTTIEITKPIVVDFLQFCKGGKNYIEVLIKDSYQSLNDYEFTWKNIQSSHENIAQTELNKQIEVVVKNIKTGCQKTFDIQSSEQNCQIPKGISANQDGLNDNLDLQNYQIRKLTVFNRFGTKVYEYIGAYKNQWHGQNQHGNLLPSGTYFYNIVTKDEKIEGYIYLTNSFDEK